MKNKAAHKKNPLGLFFIPMGVEFTSLIMIDYNHTQQTQLRMQNMKSLI
jgi:hypothetical protein